MRRAKKVMVSTSLASGSVLRNKFSELLKELLHSRIQSCACSGILQIRKMLSHQYRPTSSVMMIPNPIVYLYHALEFTKCFVLLITSYISSSMYDSISPPANCPGVVSSILLEVLEIRAYLFLLYLHVFTYPVSPSLYAS